jgi:hypothetical protein
MLASGPAILSALFLIQAETQFEAGGRIEGRVGQAPSVIPTNAANANILGDRGQVMVAATPTLSLRLLDEVDDLRANSATRILWRPIPLYASRPLFLETIDANHTKRVSKRSRIQLTLRGSYGEEDYTSLQLQLPTQPALPAAATVFSIQGSVNDSWRASRRTTLTLQLGLVHRQTLDGQTGSSGAAGSSPTIVTIPTQTTITAVPGLTHALSRRSNLEVSAPVSDTDVQAISSGTARIDALNVLTVQPQVAIRGELTRHHQLRLAAGFSHATALRQTNTSLSGYPTPLLQIDLHSLLQQTRTAVVRSTLSAATISVVDPILGVVVWRGTAQARLDADLRRRWTVGARLAFSTDLGKPLQAVDGYAPDETVISADLPVRYRWSNQWSAEFGGRYIERGPHLMASNFTWRSGERELWLYLTLISTSTRLSTRS